MKKNVVGPGLVALVAFMLASGCVPNATTYYRPSVDVAGSTHEKSQCVPTEKYVHFDVEAGDQTLKVKGQGSTYSHSYAEGTEGQYVIVGNWREIRFKHEDFLLAIPGSDARVRPAKTYGDRSEHDGYSMFNAGAVFPRQRSDRFDVIFPPLIVDGTEIQLPTLRVQKTIWAGISPFNC